MPIKPFLDTNLWVYAHLNNPLDPRCSKAWTLVNQLSRPVISPQVLAEYYEIATAFLIGIVRLWQRRWSQAAMCFTPKTCSRVK